MVRDHPQELEGPAAWKGGSFDYNTNALRTLTKDELSEIDQGLKLFEQCGLIDLLDINPATFPLPKVGRQLAGLKYDLRYGPGVILLRGLPREKYSDDQLAKIYFALGTYMGFASPQSHNGELLGSVIDITDADAGVRGYQAGGKQGFHTDGTACDIVSLMCLRAAKSGGASRLVSALAVHNALVRKDPALAQVFYDGFFYRQMDNDAEKAGIDPMSAEPVEVFAIRNGEFYCNMNSGEIKRAVEKGGVKLTDLQLEAYDFYMKIVNSDEYVLDMNIQEGDIQFVNNRSLLHGRAGYEDYDEVERRRYMLRLWLEVRDWPARPQRQIGLTFDIARRWLANRTPSMEFPTNFMRSKQADIAAKQKAGVATSRLKPYESGGSKAFFETPTPT